MSFPMNVPIAVIIAFLHILISLNLRFPDKYKHIFRAYSVLISFSFIIFLVGFPTFIYDTLPNSIQAAGIYFEGLAILYLLLFSPLVVALILLSRNWIFNIDTYSTITKYIALTGPSVLLVGLTIAGYFPFMLFFYGFN